MSYVLSPAEQRASDSASLRADRYHAHCQVLDNEIAIMVAQGSKCWKRPLPMPFVKESVGSPSCLSGIVTVISHPEKVFRYPEGKAAMLGKMGAYLIAFLVSLTVVGFFALRAENRRQHLEETINEKPRHNYLQLVKLTKKANRVVGLEFNACNTWLTKMREDRSEKSRAFSG
ncbi:MAG: hypothetical protein ACHQT8_00670 [Chlamydiales bacterium]